MIERLEQLTAAREARLQARQIAFSQALAVRAEIDRELAALDAELKSIRRQRTLWEHHWQSWLREDGVVRHGQDYNMFHVKLSAWESDIQEQYAEVKERYRAADEQVSAARSEMLKVQQRVDLLRRELARAVRQRQAHRMGIVESRTLEDVSVRRFAQQGAE